MATVEIPDRFDAINLFVQEVLRLHNNLKAYGLSSVPTSRDEAIRHWSDANNFTIDLNIQLDNVKFQLAQNWNDAPTNWLALSFPSPVIEDYSGELRGVVIPPVDESIAQIQRDADAELMRAAAANEQPTANDETLAPANGSTNTGQSNADWIFEPGLFWFKGSQYDCTPVPLAMLKYMVENPLRVSFSDSDFLNLRGVDADSVTGATIAKHISDLRSILRVVAKVIGANDYPQNDPLPKKSGGWRFLLPRK